MHALIVGGGIAGPVTAMALQRAGIDSTIFEGRPHTTDEAGSYFTVSPNGLDALQAVDALGLAASAGFGTRRNLMLSSTGRSLGSAPLGEPLADGTPALTMKRTWLARLLLDEAVRRGIRVHHDHKLVDVEDHEDGVEALFEDGSRVIGDLLVGADGVHSVTRRLIDPHAPQGRFVGLTNFGGITPAGRVDHRLEPEAWQFVFGRHAFFGSHLTPDGDTVWFANVPGAEISREERRTTTADEWRRRLSGLFAQDAGPAAELVSAGRLELAGDNTYDLPHVPTWHRGRMVVIGDAAHAPAPTSGQGASLAMEDGVCLAMALRDTESVPAAFAAFERVRRGRVEKIVAYGARGSSAKTPGRVGRIARDAALRVVFRFMVTDRALAWMYGHRIDWDEPVPSRSRPGEPVRSSTPSSAGADADREA